MNMNFEDHLPQDFNTESRVWIYQCNRLFSMHEALEIEDLIKEFIDTWNSHGIPVKGYGNLFFGQFIVLIADETGYGVSGCSTDSSVRIIKEIEKLFNVHLFDRMLLAFIVKERVQVIPMAQLGYALENGFIDATTLYFNNMVQNLGQLKSSWIIPTENSWLKKDKRFSRLIEKSTPA
ncbi:MAG: hypothetical protein ABI415_07820 [Flavitalea sp.]